MSGERTVRIPPLNRGLYIQIEDNHKALTVCSGPLQTRRIDRDLMLLERCDPLMVDKPKYTVILRLVIVRDRALHDEPMVISSLLFA